MYRITNYNEEHLKQLGFRYSSLFSSSDETFYFYRFPVWRYGSDIMIEAEFMVDCEDGECSVGVYDAYGGNGRARYSPWYDRYYGINEVVKKIDSDIEKKFKKFGIVEVDVTDEEGMNNVSKKRMRRKRARFNPKIEKEG